MALLVYDVTNRRSFESLQAWAEEVKNVAPKDVMLALIGNKSDLLVESESEYIDEV